MSILLTERMNTENNKRKGTTTQIAEPKWTEALKKDG